MSKVVAVRKDSKDRITDYKLDDGRTLNHDDAVHACLKGELEGCSVFTNRAGENSIRSDRGQDNYSLSKLPQF